MNLFSPTAREVRDAFVTARDNLIKISDEFGVDHPNTEDAYNVYLLTLTDYDMVMRMLEDTEKELFNTIRKAM